MVTAELAIALPALVLVVLWLAWLLGLGASQAVVAQAAREGARAAARGESLGVVRAAAHEVSPEATVVLRREAGLVVVTASLRRRAPIAMLRSLEREVHASSSAWAER